MPLVIFVDVDDTLIRSVGTKRIPMPAAVSAVKRLAEQGAVLYGWSSGGAVYAQTSAQELDIEACFVGFLPKPDVVLDDQSPAEWRRLIHVHPLSAAEMNVEALLAERGRVSNRGHR